LAKKIKGDPQCKECSLYETAQAVCLMGKGRVPADIMIVGEAPGLREDDIGKPFQGPAGKLLDQMLERSQSGRSNKFTREGVYITNVVKCRPPNNRAPKSKEMKTCKKYLDKEFGKVKPKYVLLLGATALKGVLGMDKITEIHGQVVEQDGISYMPTFHPSAALRDPKKQDPIESDIYEFFRMVEEGPRKYPDLEWEEVKDIYTINSCIKDVKNSEAVSFDLETTGLDWRAKGAQINVLAIATPQKQWVMSFMGGKLNKRDVQKQIVELLSEAMEGKKVIAHNGKFDNSWLRHLYGIRFPLTFDTMLAAHLLDENSPNGLKPLAAMHFKAPHYDIDSDTKKGKGSRKKLLKYAAMDVYYTLRLYYLFREKLKHDKDLLRLFKHLVMPVSNVYEDMEEEGVYIDLEKMEEVGKQISEEMKKEEDNLRHYTKRDVNWNSPQQIAQVLFTEWGLQMSKTTPAGGASTDESVLKELEGQHSAIKHLMNYKKLHKQYSAFIKGWYKRMHGDNRIYPKFKIHGTVTGRPSCVDPNLQQTPRDSKIRSLISAPSGWQLVSADYSQIELRVAAMLSGEKVMKAAYQTNEDIHTKTASEIMGIPRKQVSKDFRKKAKAVNFGLIYGMGAHGLQKYAKEKFELNMSLGESKKYRKRYFEVYSGLPTWHKRQKRKAKAYGYVRSLSGRVRRLPDIYSSNESMRAQAERQSVNTPVQGFAAELTLMGLLQISEEFSRDIVKPIGTIHDAVLMLVREGHLEETLPKVKKIMEHPRLLDKFGIRLTVPIEVDIEVGNWGEGVEWNLKEEAISY